MTTIKKPEEKKPEVKAPPREPDKLEPDANGVTPLTSPRAVADNAALLKQVPVWRRDEHGNFPTSGQVQVQFKEDAFINGVKYLKKSKHLLDAAVAHENGPVLEAPTKE